MRPGPATALIAVGLLGPLLTAGEDADEAATPRGLLQTHCVACHGPEDPRAGFRVDTAPGELASGAERARWRLAAELVDAQDMPPPEAPSHPTRTERERLVAWIRAELAAAEARPPAGGAPLRRLNRRELLNTVRDLFGIRGLELPRAFPEDVSDLPFDTMSAGLPLSAAHLDATMELAADVAGRMVFLPGQRQVTSVSDIGAWSQEASLWARDGDDTATYFSGINNAGWSGAVWDRAFIAPASGTYEVQVLANAEADAGADGAPLRLGFYALYPWDYYRPESANRVELPRVGSLDVTARAPALLTTTVDLEQGEMFHVYCENRLPTHLPQGPRNRLDLTKLFMAAVRSPRPTVRIERMTVRGPVAPLPRQTAFLGGAHPPGGADHLRSVLLPLAERAYRRPLTAREQRDLMEPVLGHLDEAGSPELALRFGIRRILLAPAFHYLDTREHGLDAYALASRLAYFLWSSLPDAELLELARTGRLGRPGVLRRQVVRMLADPKGQRFVRDFTGQWLGNQQLATLMVCDVRHPWNEVLRYGYMRSAELFFDELLQADASIRAFLDSDFTYANVPMRMVWGFPGAHPEMSLIESDLNQSHIAPEPERLDLTRLPDGVPPDVALRGGLLGLPGVLALTGDGVESSPVRRGVWVLENLYGTPPPPPPDDVPALVRDASGATTIRETLAAHQASPACASCHTRIDPVGFALENYDAAGGWRDAYHREQPTDGDPLPPRPVDATGVLPDGARLDGPQDLKRHLLAHADLFTRCLATKLLEYATGRRPSAVDARVVEQLVRDEPAGGYGLRELIVRLVESEAFRAR